MFPPRYFPTRFFAARYFPPGAEEAIVSLHGRRRGRKLPDPVELKSPEGLDKPPQEPPLAAKVIEYPTFDPSGLKGRVDGDIVAKVAGDMKARRELRALEKTKRKKRRREEDEAAFIMSFFDD